MKTSRDKGYLLEEKIADMVRELDPTARPTNGSGAKGERGDIYVRSLPLLIECKYRAIKNLIINMDWWNHLLFRLPHGSPRKPVLVVGNDTHTFAVMDINDYMELIKQAYGGSNG